MIQQLPLPSSSGSGGQLPTTLIKNGMSTSGFTPPVITLNTLNSGSLLVDTSAITGAANALLTVLSLTGPGSMDVLVAYFAVAPTSWTLRCKLTIDGIVVFDSTSTPLTNTNRGAVIIGTLVSTTNVSAIPCKFNSSLLLEMASSATVVANTFGCAYTYRLGT